MLNRVRLIGNVGSTPEIKDVNGTKLVTFSLATSESYKDKQGEKITNTEWHNIVIWRKLAEIVEKFIKKGDKLYLEGKIKNESYEKDGVKKYATKIVCNNMIMLGSKKDSQTSHTPKNTAQTNAEPEDFNNVDDLPF